MGATPPYPRWNPQCPRRKSRALLFSRLGGLGLGGGGVVGYSAGCPRGGLYAGCVPHHPAAPTFRARLEGQGRNSGLPSGASVCDGGLRERCRWPQGVSVAPTPVLMSGASQPTRRSTPLRYAGTCEAQGFAVRCLPHHSDGGRVGHAAGIKTTTWSACGVPHAPAVFAKVPLGTYEAIQGTHTLVRTEAQPPAPHSRHEPVIERSPGAARRSPGAGCVRGL